MTHALRILGSLAALSLAACTTPSPTPKAPTPSAAPELTPVASEQVPVVEAEAPPPAPDKIIVFMLDGLGITYLESTELPTLEKLKREGLYKQVQATMPTVTNSNNAGICTGLFPEQHGITGNSYLTAEGEESYMEEAELLLAPTLFERADKYGVSSALLSAKKKTIALLSKGTELAMSPQTAEQEWIDRLGTPPDIYSREVNYWLMDAALWVLANRKDISLLYVHTTDFPMHNWPPSAPESIEHLKKLDEYLGKIIATEPNATILITADHDVNHKTQCWDLGKALKKRKAPVRIAISAEKDKYPKHHRGFGGVSYVYLNAPGDAAKVVKQLKTLPGIKDVLTREEAAAKFHLMPERIGDLVVTGDAVTVFGELDKTERETLPETYRTHGSEFELAIPLFVYHAKAAPPAEQFEHNKDLAAWLYPAAP
jgi:phosphonoacetate hydrolase